MASNMFAWDLVYKLAEKDIRKKEDVLVVFLHWFLMKSGFKCVGVGDNKVLLDSEVGSETLPDGWNVEDTYALRYCHNKKLFILRGVRSEGDIIFNFLRVSDLSVSNITFNVDDTVHSLKGPIETLIPTYSDILYNIQKDLVDPVFSGKKRTVSTQTAEEESSRTADTPSRFRYEDDPLRVPRRDIDPGFGSSWDPLTDPMAVGRSDLDPFSPGGGMLFNPFGSGGSLRPQPEGGIGNPGGLPRGSVPPGARFDPFGPPGIGPGFGPSRGGRGGRTGFGAPNPDHLPPPGFDDMFM